MPYTPILATLGYVFSPDRRQVLLIHRNARPSDPHYGKYNGLGGKLERNEHIVQGMTREIHEEAGIVCEQLQLAGTISWPGFGKHGEDWFGFIFRIFHYTGTPKTHCDEGELVWTPLEAVEQLPLWPGDRYFLADVLNVTSLPFHGVMPYSSGQPTGWEKTYLPG